jgi:membrane protein DedA with SNARE-associated domain
VQAQAKFRFRVVRGDIEPLDKPFQSVPREPNGRVITLAWGRHGSPLEFVASVAPSFDIPRFPMINAIGIRFDQLRKRRRSVERWTGGLVPPRSGRQSGSARVWAIVPLESGNLRLGAGLGSDAIVARLGYVGIILVLVLGGLGLPVPEEAPIILAAVLARNGQMNVPMALASCFIGVLVGDFVVYALGYFQGERVLSFRLTRRFLSREREAQIKGYFHRHGIRILITGRFVPGFRTAAYLTAGILRLPPMRLFLADLCAASMSTLLMFGLGYFFAQWVEAWWKQAQGYAIIGAAIGIVAFLLHRQYKASKRGGQVVGPPVSLTDEVPVPIDDLHSGFLKKPKAADAETVAPEVSAAVTVSEPNPPEVVSIVTDSPPIANHAPIPNSTTDSGGLVPCVAPSLPSSDAP